MRSVWILAAVLYGCFALPGSAARIFIDSTAVTATASNGQSFSTRIMASGNWDMMLGRTDNTNSTANYRSWDFNTNPGRTTVINKDLAFTLEHRAGQGYLFTVVNPLTVGSVTRVLAWGSFSPAVVANSQAALLNGNAPGLDVNAIRLQTRTSAGGAAAQLILNSLSFNITSPGVDPQIGRFQNTVTRTSTPASSWTNLTALGSAFADPVGYQSQWIFVDENLTSLNWQLQGIVRIGTNTQRNENVRLNITGYDLELEFPQDVPEPGTYLLIGVGLAVLGLVRLRRKG